MLPVGASALEYLTTSSAFLCTYVAELKDGSSPNIHDGDEYDSWDEDDADARGRSEGEREGHHWAAVSLSGPPGAFKRP